MKVYIPFLDMFEPLMLTGKKSATSRTKRYGYAGDWFEAFGRSFVLTEVYMLRLSVIEWNHYLEEGFNYHYEFRQVWEQLHPRAGFQPDKRVYFHKFKLQSQVYPFHVHELTDSGKCRICGCDPISYLDSQNQGEG